MVPARLIASDATTRPPDLGCVNEVRVKLSASDAITRPLDPGWGSVGRMAGLETKAELQRPWQQLLQLQLLLRGPRGELVSSFWLAEGKGLAEEAAYAGESPGALLFSNWFCC